MNTVCILRYVLHVMYMCVCVCPYISIYSLISSHSLALLSQNVASRPFDDLAHLPNAMGFFHKVKVEQLARLPCFFGSPCCYVFVESPSCYPEDEVFGFKVRVERLAKQLKRQSCLATQIIMVIRCDSSAC